MRGLWEQIKAFETFQAVPALASFSRLCDNLSSIPRLCMNITADVDDRRWAEINELVDERSIAAFSWRVDEHYCPFRREVLHGCEDLLCNACVEDAFPIREFVQFSVMLGVFDTCSAYLHTGYMFKIRRERDGE